MKRPKGEPDPIKQEAEQGFADLRKYLDLHDQFHRYVDTHPRPDEPSKDTP